LTKATNDVEYNYSFGPAQYSDEPILMFNVEYLKKRNILCEN